MNSVTAVLLALVLIAVILLIVWLVLRSRSSDLPRRSTTYGPGPGAGAGAGGPGASVLGPMSAHQGEDAPSGDTATEDKDDDRSPAEDDEPVSQPVGDPDAAAEEFMDAGLSELDTDASDASNPDVETSQENADGVLSGTPPRTPTEAFGSANASGDLAAHEAASRETSLMDRDVDSTPLFRSIREEFLGTVALANQEAATGTDAETIDDALAGEVVAEQPDVHPSWSDERREGDEQAHAETPDALEGSAGLHAEAASVEAQENVWSETVTEGAVETGAVGAGSVGPDQEEEELLETDEQTAGEVVETDSAAVRSEHPPMRRISELHEVTDGGFGIGSAATIADGAQPLGHPIKASVDLKAYQDLHSPGYDETEPDVWFLDAGFAERAGFHRAE